MVNKTTKKENVTNKTTKKTSDKNTVTVQEKIIYKLGLKWKVLIGISLAFNVLILAGVASFTNYGKNYFVYQMTGNTYPMAVLEHDGLRQWKKVEKRNGYRFKQDRKQQRKYLVQLKKMLASGYIDKAEFEKAVKNIQSYRQANMQRFIDNFPTFWNSLTLKKQREYMRRNIDKHGADDWD